jgi:hypothetical protein
MPASSPGDLIHVGNHRRNFKITNWPVVSDLLAVLRFGPMREPLRVARPEGRCRALAGNREMLG